MKRIFLLALVAFSCGRLTAAEPPMNILVLLADDWRYDTLGVAVHPVVQTPNLDRFARTRRFALRRPPGRAFMDTVG